MDGMQTPRTWFHKPWNPKLPIGYYTGGDVRRDRLGVLYSTPVCPNAASSATGVRRLMAAFHAPPAPGLAPDS
jgi:hypothetical protein